MVSADLPITVNDLRRFAQSTFQGLSLVGLDEMKSTIICRTNLTYEPRPMGVLDFDRYCNNMNVRSIIPRTTDGPHPFCWSSVKVHGLGTRTMSIKSHRVMLHLCRQYRLTWVKIRENISIVRVAGRTYTASGRYCGVAASLRGKSHNSWTQTW